MKIRLHAPPVDGAANAELVRFLAERLGVTPSALRIVAGHRTRQKRVEVDGYAPGEIERRILGGS